MFSRASVILITFCGVATLASTAAFGQSKTGPTGPSTGTGSSGLGTKTNLPSPTTIPTTPTTPSAPIFVSGRVLAEDGNPPPELAKIERVCNGNAHAEGYADGDGYFSIQLNNDLDVLQDASETGSSMPSGSGMPTAPGLDGQQQQSNSVNGSMTNRRLQNCDLRAQVPGYRSQLISLALRQPLDNPDIGVILVHRQDTGESGTVISTRSLAAPKEAQKAFQKGLELTRKGKTDEAEKSFVKAVTQYPDYAAAWCELGKLQSSNGQFDRARDSFEHASKADPKYVDPYLELSRLALHDGKWAELAELTDKAASLDSFDYPLVFLFSAVARFNLHQLDAAQKSIVRAETLDARHQFPEIAHLHGLILLQRRDYAAAAERLRAYLTLAPDAADAEKVRAQLAKLEKLTAATAKQTGQ